jgi:hypothetical protein
VAEAGTQRANSNAPIAQQCQWFSEQSCGSFHQPLDDSISGRPPFKRPLGTGPEIVEKVLHLRKTYLGGSHFSGIGLTSGAGFSVWGSSAALSESGRRGRRQNWGRADDLTPRSRTWVSSGKANKGPERPDAQ